MNNALDKGAVSLQKALARAARLRSRRKRATPAADYDSIGYAQAGTRLELAARFGGGLRPQGLVVWAGQALVAEGQLDVTGQGGNGAACVASVNLDTVLLGWNTMSWPEGEDIEAAKTRDTDNAAPDAESSEILPALDDAADEAADATGTGDTTTGSATERVVTSGTASLYWKFTGTAGSIVPGASRIAIPGRGGLLTQGELRKLVDAGDIDPSTPVTYHRGVARFAHTTAMALPGTRSVHGSVRPYINRKGYLALAINRPLKPGIQTLTHLITASGGKLRIEGSARTRHSRILQARLLVEGRRSRHLVAGRAEFLLDQAKTSADFGRGHYNFSAELDFGATDWSLVSNADNYDLWWEFVLAESDEPVRVRVNRTPYAVRTTSRSGTVVRGGQTLVVTPYFTFKAKATSLILEVVDTDAFRALEEFNPALDLAARGRRRPVWLVGELPYKAQDNGLHFFRYLRREHPEIDAYYVIDHTSPEVRNLDGVDHVLEWGSREHFVVALQADRFISTHHAEYLFPTRHPDFKHKAHGTRVFLQHGVMGTKWMVPNYGKRSAGFSTDLFLVSSAREQQYIVRDFGYDIEETAVTGLPRYDSLFAGDVQLRPRQLLVIPTWRDWLQNDEMFAESEYLRTWSEFLHSPELAAMVDAEGLEVVFCLHPNMQRFRSHFETAPARVVAQGEIDVQELMKQSAALVTDYSSVGFDFSFLDRPVFYLQFDRGRFLGANGSHLDLDRELPGEISLTVPRLLEQLRKALDRDLSMTEESRRRAQKFLDHRDRNNCARVFDAVESARHRRGPVSTVASSELMDRVENRLRRNRYYFPVMKAMQRLVQRFPMQRGLMVFESGLGKQYADSPRYLYEELLRRGDTRPKVWIYSGRQEFPDPQTRVVKRLSPSYFWYLGRANYWITNQNLPFYMTRRRNATYLQTWHGTPLKHMLHDLEEIHGRDEGYLARVDRAISQWTHLLSPSPYATEVMRSAFAYDGKVVEEGYPRNDVFFGTGLEERVSSVRGRLGIDPAAKVVLYAPTFRDNASNGRGRFTFQLPFDLEEFDRGFGKDTVLVLRMHVLVANAIEIPEELRERIIDASRYSEIQELYLVSDVLVTDYSSVFFDYATLRRPIVFYAYDLEVYRDSLRGFYLDYLQEVPGPVVETQEEFFTALRAALDGDRQDHGRYEDFVRRFAPLDDGYAARRVVDRVLGVEG
ncbi:CDP-glycerol glycerophosphotransferase family protein [Arthrobacter sp. JSM 101049]|uniref:CDP-glycerol glycerophosphotransferase family protein n=1 Tax=Arthrobacter sp. JSM 101049 TaxID=929097 RepID=UPI003561B713